MTAPVTARDWEGEAMSAAPFALRAAYAWQPFPGVVQVELHPWPGCAHVDRVVRRVSDRLDAVRPVGCAIAVTVWEDE